MDNWNTITKNEKSLEIISQELSDIKLTLGTFIRNIRIKGHTIHEMCVCHIVKQGDLSKEFALNNLRSLLSIKDGNGIPSDPQQTALSFLFGPEDTDRKMAFASILKELYKDNDEDYQILVAYLIDKLATIDSLNKSFNSSKNFDTERVVKTHLTKDEYLKIRIKKLPR